MLTRKQLMRDLAKARKAYRDASNDVDLATARAAVLAVENAAIRNGLARYGKRFKLIWLR